MAKKHKPNDWLKLTECNLVDDSEGNFVDVNVVFMHLGRRCMMDRDDLLKVLDTFRPLPKRYAVMQSVTKQIVQCFTTNEDAQKHKQKCGSQYIVKDLLQESETVIDVEPAAIGVEE